MTTEILKFSADLILKDLAEYISEEHISLDTVHRIMQCEAGVDLTSNAIAFISERLGSAQAYLDSARLIEEGIVVDELEAYSVLVGIYRQVEGWEDDEM